MFAYSWVEQGGLRTALSLRGKGKKMIKMFNVNGRSYKAKEFDFNLLCDLEEQGLSLEDIDKKPMSLIRTYLAFCGNITKEQAGREIEGHLANGGKFEDVVQAMSDQMNSSGFFRALSQEREETENTETSTASRKSKKG